MGFSYHRAGRFASEKVRPYKPGQLVESGEPLPFSLDLPGAAKYTSISDSVIREAVHAGELHVVNDKPITVLRSDLEAWVESRRHRYRVPVLKSGLSKP